MIVKLIYLFEFIVTFLVFTNYICRKEYQTGVNFFISITLLVRSYGELMIACSNSLDMALFAYIMLYFGSAFLPTLIFISAARLCKVEMPIVTEIATMSYSGMIFLLALTIGKSDIYYGRVWLIKNVTEYGSYTSLGKEYGPGHTFYTIMVVGYAVAFLWLAYRTYRMKNRVSRKIVTEVAVIAMSIIGLYIFQRVSATSFSFISVAYFIATVLSVRVFSNTELHNLTDSILDSFTENGDEGFVVFDKHENFINANEKAKEIYPEISDLFVGKKVTEENSNFSKQVVAKVREYLYGLLEPENDAVVTVGENKYEIKMNDIQLRKGGEPEGVFVEIENVTVRENIAAMEAKYSRDLEADVEKKGQSIRNMQNSLVLGLATLVESRDSSTGDHIVRTLKGVEIFTEQLKKSQTLEMSDRHFYAVKLATAMHDLGKIAIDNEILRAHGGSVERDETIIRLHTEEGARIVRKVLAGISDVEEGRKFIEIAVAIANYHHERWDGSGLPYGLRGKEIPLEARIVAYVDALDTLMDDGDKKGKKSFNEAFDIIVNKIGTEFDPDLGADFVKCRKELSEIYEGL